MFGQFLSTTAWTLASRSDYVFQSLLAVSACHMRYLTKNAQSHQVAEHYHQVLALRSFQSALVPAKDQNHADSLVFTSMLLNLLAFAYVENDSPQASWVFSTSDSRLDWLKVCMGLKPLLYSTRRWREGSSLKPVFEASDDEWRSFTTYGMSLEGVPGQWMQMMFGNSDSAALSTPRRDFNIFREPIRILAKLRSTEPSVQNVTKFTQFIGALDPPFLELLLERDERALFVFGYWLGLMCHFEIWWGSLRVKRDFDAIRLWLQQLKLENKAGKEGEMWRVLLVELDQSCLGVQNVVNGA
jgi:hypothetical protein